ncbi:hypothetical protein GCM10009786_27880 [Leucobacter alluvii]|uniref:Uncharacterized protein n=2 Tax=Leucobacter TaxID=55968 RepID=A0ABP5N5L7_9MICO|nr:hypothetical protein [Leucobacter sp. L43]
MNLMAHAPHIALIELQERLNKRMAIEYAEHPFSELPTEEQREVLARMARERQARWEAAMREAGRTTSRIPDASARRYADTVRPTGDGSIPLIHG